MRSISKIVFLGFILLWMACEVPEDPELDNPIDTNTVPGDTTVALTPALVLFPADATVNLGFSITVEHFVVAIENLSGAQLRLNYDQNKLEVLSIVAGDVFASGMEELFLYEHNASSGTIDLYTSYLGDGTTLSVDGSHSFATINFRTSGGGDAIVRFEAESCQLRDPEDNPLIIRRVEEAVIHVE